MKKMGIAILAGLLMSVSASAKNDYIFVEYKDVRERIRVLDLDKVSVCSIKAQVADMFDLDERKFDLRRNHGPRLDDKKTLSGAYVNNANTLMVTEVNRSNQCR